MVKTTIQITALVLALLAAYSAIFVIEASKRGL